MKQPTCRCLIKAIIPFLLCYLIFVENAYAYIQPGLTTLLLQLIMGLLAGSAFAVKLFWGKIKIFFTKLFFKGKSRL